MGKPDKKEIMATESTGAGAGRTEIRPISESERAAIIAATAGSLTPEEGEELAHIIEKGCERVDERDW